MKGLRCTLEGEVACGGVYVISWREATWSCWLLCGHLTRPISGQKSFMLNLIPKKTLIWFPILYKSPYEKLSCWLLCGHLLVNNWYITQFPGNEQVFQPPSPLQKLLLEQVLCNLAVKKQLHAQDVRIHFTEKNRRHQKNLSVIFIYMYMYMYM